MASFNFRILKGDLMKSVHVHIFLDIELDGALYPHKVSMAVPRLTEGDMLSSVI